MKRILIALVVVVLAIVAISSMVDMGKDVKAGETYRGPRGDVTVDYVGRGDSVLLKFPGAFKLTDDELRAPLVVFSASGHTYYQNALIFKQKYERVHSTPPGTRQP